MAIYKLDHASEDVNNDLYWAHEHGTFDFKTKKHGNLDALNRIDDAFINKVNDQLLPKTLAGIDTAELKRIIEEDIKLDFMTPASLNVPNLRLGDDWVKLSDYERITRIMGHEGRIDVVHRQGSTETGNPLDSFTLSLSKDTISKLDSVPNKLDKLSVSDAGNKIVVANADGTVARTNILVDHLVQISNLSSDLNTSSSTTAASSKAVHEVYVEVEKLKNGVSSCRGRVVNAYTAPSKSAFCNITAVEVSYAGRGYAVGEYVSLDAVDAVIPAYFVITEVTESGGIVSLEVADNGGYYSDTFDPTLNVSYAICGGGGMEAQVKVTGVLSGVNAHEHTTLSSIADPNPGDTVYVMQDELHGMVTSMYLYKEEKGNGNDVTGSWIYIMASDSNVICRYEEDITHLEGDEVFIQRIN